MLKRLNTENRGYDPGEQCEDDTCPVVYELTDVPAKVRVQGLRVADTSGQENFDSARETAVEIPAAVLIEAAQKLMARR
jgi:hypothetical protein